MVIRLHSFRSSLPRQKQEAIIGPEKKAAYLTIPYPSEHFYNEVKRRVRAVTALVFPAVEQKMIFATTKIPVRLTKDPLPLSCTSNIVPEFTCNCGDSYVGRTEKGLAKRTEEHLPKWLLRQKSRRSAAEPTSAVACHAIACTSFNRSQPRLNFKKIVSVSHPLLLPYLEAVVIASLRPVLCIQKQTVLTLALPQQ